MSPAGRCAVSCVLAHRRPLYSPISLGAGLPRSQLGSRPYVPPPGSIGTIKSIKSGLGYKILRQDPLLGASGHAFPLEPEPDFIVDAARGPLEARLREVRGGGVDQLLALQLGGRQALPAQRLELALAALPPPRIVGLAQHHSTLALLKVVAARHLVARRAAVPWRGSAALSALAQVTAARDRRWDVCRHTRASAAKLHVSQAEQVRRAGDLRDM